MRAILHNRKLYIPLIFLLSCVFFGVLMYCSPLISDDIEFAGLTFRKFSDVVRYALYYGNGRLLGNIGAVCLSRLPVLRVAVKALTISLMVVLLPYVMDCRTVSGYLLSFILTAAMPSALFGEIFTWTSGFQNYIPPVCLSLAAVAVMRKAHQASKPARIAGAAVIALLGTASQLYVEHSTIVNLLSSAALLFSR